MADLLKTGSDWLLDQQKEHAAQSVTYARGSSEIEDVQAIVGRTTADVIEQDGTYTRVETRDFIIQAADLVIDETIIEPARGDTIQEGGVTYEVMPLGNEAAARADSYGKAWRIHTKRVL